MDPIFSQQFNMPAPQASGGGMFGGSSAPNKTWSIIAAMLNGFNAGMPGPQHEAGLQGLQGLQQMMLMRQQRQQSLEDYNRKRADDNTDFQAHRQFEVDHPLPTSNDTANDYSFWQQHLTPDQFTQWLQKQYDPEVSVPLPGGSMYVGPRSGMPGALGGKPAASKPLTDADIERMSGGQTPPASGGFPNGPYTNIGPYPRY